MSQDPIVIVAAQRTPIGNFQGNLSSLEATQLGAAAIQGTYEAAGIDPNHIHSAIMGCVLPAGLGQAPARQAAVGAGLPMSTGCTTINKMCGSGMKAVMLAHDIIIAGSQEVMVAGGMESMSNAPYLLPQARQGYRMGNKTVVDHMIFDGLTDGFTKERHMGSYADDCAQHYSFSREAQDSFAIGSIARARKAQENGHFKQEITPISVKQRKETINIEHDQGPQTAMPEKIAKLRPAFSPQGTVTAANASSISDGAASLLLMRQSKAKELGLTALAKIVAHSTCSQAPEWFTTAPIGAIKMLFTKTGWDANSVDLFEINEAFAVVAMAAIQELSLPQDKVNVHGGACVLGHPIGASGARILVTLIHALRQLNKTRGVAALCIGGGEATAMAIEMIS